MKRSRSSGMAVHASASKAQQPVDHQNRLIQSAWSRADLDHLRRFTRIVCAENVEKRFLTTEAPQVDHRRCTRMIQKLTPIWRPAVEYLNVPYISHPLTHLGCRSQRITILTTPTMQDFMNKGYLWGSNANLSANYKGTKNWRPQVGTS